jgi:hypothetical protein
MTLTNIQKKQIKARLIRLVFLGEVEKKPVINMKTLTPMIEKPSRRCTPNETS